MPCDAARQADRSPSPRTRLVVEPVAAVLVAGVVGQGAVARPAIVDPVALVEGLGGQRVLPLAVPLGATTPGGTRSDARRWVHVWWIAQRAVPAYHPVAPVTRVHRLVPVDIVALAARFCHKAASLAASGHTWMSVLADLGPPEGARAHIPRSVSGTPRRVASARRSAPIHSRFSALSPQYIV